MIALHYFIGERNRNTVTHITHSRIYLGLKFKVSKPSTFGYLANILFEGSCDNNFNLAHNIKCVKFNKVVLYQRRYTDSFSVEITEFQLCHVFHAITCEFCLWMFQCAYKVFSSFLI